MPLSDKANRLETDFKDTVFDAGFLLRASQLHVRPNQPEVAKLVKDELRWGIGIISHIQGLHLLVGKESIEAFQQDDGSEPSNTSIKSGTQLAIKGVEDSKVIVLTDNRPPLHISPDTLATTLVNGGEIFLSDEDSLDLQEAS